MSAAMAPSVETIGVTIPTLPTRSARYTRSRPAVLPAPATTSHATVPASASAGVGPASAQGRTMIRPTSMTQPRTGSAPIMRDERDEQRVAVAQAIAEAAEAAEDGEHGGHDIRRGPGPGCR